MSSLNLKALRAFVAVMQHGTLTNAAERIYRTQPTTSRLIATLEDELQLPLFERSRQRLIPTAAADAFYREALRILATVDDVPRIAEEIRNSDFNRLSIITVSRIAESIVAPAVAEMVRNDPTLRVNVEVRSLVDLERWAFGRQDGITLTSLPVSRIDLKSHILFSGPLTAIVPEDRPLSRKKRVRIQDLDAQPLIVLRRETLLRDRFDQLFRDAGIRPSIIAETTNALTAASMAANGVGIALLDAFVPVDMLIGRARMLAISPETKETFGLIKAMESDLTRNGERTVQAILKQVKAHRARLRAALGASLNVHAENE